MSNVNLRIGAIGLALTLAATTAWPEDAKFTAGPTAAKEGNQTKISFAVSAATDVEVAVLDSRGDVARHLAAGLLGPNAPEPLRKESLAQEVFWDGRDDAGKPAAGGPFKVRVRLGLQPRLAKILGRNDNTLSGSICALTTTPQGELFVLLADPFRGRAELRVLDRRGRYLRTVMPYAADTPEARTEPVGHVKIDGRRHPLVFNGQGHSFYPLVAGLRGQTMAWHPEGYLLAASAVGSMCNHGPPRHLIAFHPGGGAPEKTGFVGPLIRKPRGFMGGSGEGGAIGMDRLAVSRDGRWIYLVQDFKRGYLEKGERRHGVYRLRWSDKELGDVWLGAKEPGDADAQFNDPQGLAVDSQDRLYVCDRGNGRVKVYSGEGRLLGKFPVGEPEQIAVDPTGGEIYVLCRKALRSYDIMGAGGGPAVHCIVKFAPWTGEAPRELARLEFDVKKRVAEFMALDASAGPRRLWVSFYTGYNRPNALVPIDEEGATFREGQPAGESGGLHYPTFLAADPRRKRLIVAEFASSHCNVDLGSGAMTPMRLPGSDLTFDRDGNIYLMGGYNSNALLRLDGEGKPLPFPATGTNKLTVKFRAYGPNMGLRGHCIAPNGDLYVRRSPDHACVTTVDVWGPDGTPKKPALINGAGSGDSGIGVDNRGNIYLGMNLKPADQPIPADFARAVPGQPWKYYRQADRKPPWSYLYANPYLFHMGAIFKFAPEGGRIYGNYSPKAPFIDDELALAKAPSDAADYKSGYLRWDVKVVGAKWRYGGIGIIPHSFDGFTGDDGCECLQSQLDVDPYGRVYAPSAFYSSVEMVDSAGNRLARIGTYGNADSAGPGSRMPEPEIAFAWPAECDYAEADGRLYVSDSVNRRIVVVKFDAAAVKTCDVP